jgi:hypothetical protein
VPPTSPASSSPSGGTGHAAPVGDVVGDPPGVGHDRQRGVGAGPGRERPASLTLVTPVGSPTTPPHVIEWYPRRILRTLPSDRTSGSLRYQPLSSSGGQEVGSHEAGHRRRSRPTEDPNFLYTQDEASQPALQNWFNPPRQVRTLAAASSLVPPMGRMPRPGAPQSTGAELFAAGRSLAEVAHTLDVARQTSAAGTPTGAPAAWRRCAAPARLGTRRARPNPACRRQAGAAAEQPRPRPQLRCHS